MARVPLMAINTAPMISEPSISVPHTRLERMNAQISPVYSNGASNVAVARRKLANSRNCPIPPTKPAANMPSQAGAGAGVWVHGKVTPLHPTNTTLVINICSSTVLLGSTWRNWI